MASKHKRSLIFNLNPIQQKIILPVFLSCFFTCFVSFACLAYMYFPAEDPTNPFSEHIYYVRLALPWLLVAMSLLLLFIVFWTYYVSNKIVGPYTRVLKELDHVIESGEKKAIGTRRGDIMFEEIVKRVNTIIDRLP